MDILCEIQKNYTLFSEKEKYIADYILANPSQIKNINISELSAAAGISNSTVTRFCRKIGCSSFAEMKVKLSAPKGYENDFSSNEVFSDIYNFYKSAIDMTNKLIDKEMILKLVKEIRSAKKIYICGLGNSGITASEFALRLLRMGFDVSGITDSHLMIINSSILKKDALIIGISLSGETFEVAQALKIAKLNGAKTVAMTNFEHSSITKYSDMTFLLYNCKFLNKSHFVNDQFAAIYCIDLISSVLLKDKTLNDKMKLTIDTIINFQDNNSKKLL